MSIKKIPTVKIRGAKGILNINAEDLPIWRAKGYSEYTPLLQRDDLARLRVEAEARARTAMINDANAAAVAASPDNPQPVITLDRPIEDAISIQLPSARTIKRMQFDELRMLTRTLGFDFDLDKDVEKMSMAALRLKVCASVDALAARKRACQS
jgi:hypothetical protein